MSPEPDSLTTCVRRFGRESSAPGETKGFEHITGARMAKSNGHEVRCTLLWHTYVIQTDLVQVLLCMFSLSCYILYILILTVHSL